MKLLEFSEPITRNFVSMWKEISKIKRLKIEYNNYFLATISELDDENFNCLFNLNYKNHHFSFILEKIIEYISIYKKNHCIWVPHDSSTEEYINMLVNFNYYRPKKMTAIILNNPKKYHSIYSSNVKVEINNTWKDFNNWVIPFKECFFLTEKDSFLFAKLLFDLNKISNNFLHFTAYIENRPVSICSVFFDEYGYAGLYNGASLREGSKYGAFSKIINVIIDDVVKRDCKSIVAQCTDDSLNVLSKRFNFERCFNYSLLSFSHN